MDTGGTLVCADVIERENRYGIAHSPKAAIEMANPKRKTRDLFFAFDMIILLEKEIAGGRRPQ